MTFSIVFGEVYIFPGVSVIIIIIVIPWDERGFIIFRVHCIVSAFRHNTQGYTYVFEILNFENVYVYPCDGRAPKPASVALGESARCYEGRADREAHHLQPLGGQPRRDPVRLRAQAGGERGHRRGLSGPLVQPQP